MSTAAFEVLPTQDVWVIRIAGAPHTELADTKAMALQRARYLGRGAGGFKIRVLKEDGQLESEISAEAS